MTMHSQIVISCGALIVAMVAWRSAAPSAAEPNAAVQGVWRTLEVVVPGATGRTFKPTATLAIFHGRHYSRVEVHAEQPRPLLGNAADASADDVVLAPVDRGPLHAARPERRIEVSSEGVLGLVVVVVGVEDGVPELFHHRQQ